MIFVRLKGGLGNQLFQYATGLRLARKRNTNLKLDARVYENDPLRFYALNVFNISARIATNEELLMIKPRRWSFKNLFQPKFNLKSSNPCLFLTEKHFHVAPEILEAPDNVYLDGYWQSEQYFKNIEGIIREEFSFKEPLEGKNKKMMEEIRNVVSVSLHIRRGDYVTNKAAQLVHGTCSLDYYARCAEIICTRRRNVRFYVFTDDPKWAAENLRLPSAMTLVEGNQNSQSYKDLQLMSACRDNIVANSSFSWWGAWLNPNPQKIVLAPKHWFITPKYNTADLFPDNWQQI
jgi:hypothetical protein